MRKDFEQFSRASKIAFIIFNICTISSTVILFIIYSVVKATDGVNEASLIGLAMVIVFGIFCAVNLARIFVEGIKKRKIENVIEKMIVDKKYNEGLEYLKQAGKSKNFYNINQMMYSYLGYLYFSLDVIDEAIYYMKKIDVDKQYVVNSNYLVLRIYLLYLYYFINNDEVSLKEVVSVYHNKKTNLLKVIRSSEGKIRINRIFDIIEGLNRGEKQSSILKLADSNVSSIPFIKRYIEQSL